MHSRNESSDQRPSAGPSRPTWILALLLVALVVGFVNVGVFIYGMTLPDKWSVRQSIVINADASDIFPLLDDLRRWREWSSWSERNDPTLEFTYDGPDHGAGASFSWIGERLGSGTITIQKSEENRSISYALELQGEPFSDAGQIRLRPLVGGTSVIWTDGGELEGTLGRLFRDRLETSVAADLSRSLRELKTVVENQQHP